MPTNVIMPQMGESIAEGTLTRWLKKPGDAIKRDEPLFEISTDKVDAEIPAPPSGTLLEIVVEEGKTVAINTVVARIGELAPTRFGNDDRGRVLQIGDAIERLDIAAAAGRFERIRRLVGPVGAQVRLLDRERQHVRPGRDGVYAPRSGQVRGIGTSALVPRIVPGWETERMSYAVVNDNTTNATAHASTVSDNSTWAAAMENCTAATNPQTPARPAVSSQEWRAVPATGMDMVLVVIILSPCSQTRRGTPARLLRQRPRRPEVPRGPVPHPGSGR